MVKGADWFLSGAERIGLAAGLSPFIVGVTIVAAGTSLPELISSLFALGQGATEIVAANAIGSNIANILLIIGISSLIGKKLIIDKDLINLDLPLLATTTGLFLAVAWDKSITRPEAIILVLAYVIYFLYTLFYKESSAITEDDLALESKKTEHALEKLDSTSQKQTITFKEIAFLILGALGLIFGAQYLIESVINLSAIWSIAPGVIAITAIAFGTSLPELLVSGLAAYRGKTEVAIGNVLGSNVFNLLLVVGIPGIIQPLTLDTQTFTLGLPFLIISTVLFIFAGISRKIHLWEGSLFLLIYILFIGKLFGFF